MPWRAGDGSLSLVVRLSREALWLGLNQVAALFERDKSIISRHLRNVSREGELERGAVAAPQATAAADGKTCRVDTCNLDAVISVGCRVNWKRGSKFRIRATRVVRDHPLAGCTVNERKRREPNQAVRLVANVAGRQRFAARRIEESGRPPRGRGGGPRRTGCGRRGKYSRCRTRAETLSGSASRRRPARLRVGRRDARSGDRHPGQGGRS